jgi:hypothetical protein
LRVTLMRYRILISVGYGLSCLIFTGPSRIFKGNVGPFGLCHKIFPSTSFSVRYPFCQIFPPFDALQYELLEALLCEQYVKWLNLS